MKWPKQQLWQFKIQNWWIKLLKTPNQQSSLRKLGFGEDVDFCLQRDKSNLVPEFKDGLIRILE